MPATVADFRNYHEPVRDLPVERNIYLSTLIDEAQWQVEEFAPPPDAEDATELLDYDNRLTTAQLKIAAYLYHTGGFRSNTGSLGKLGSQSFDVQGQAVYEGARKIMGPFASNAVAYLSRKPL